LVSKIELPNELVHPRKTGYWKLEEQDEGFISHASKSYKLGEESTAKGLQKEEAQLLDYLKLQTESVKIKSKTSFKTNQGVIITKREKIFQSSLANLKKDLINGRWVNRSFNYDWAWWNKQEKIIKERALLPSWKSKN
jgi:hypothetical protein